MHTYMYICTYTHTPVQVSTHTPIHPYTHTHTHIHPYTHTPIHPYTHTPIHTVLPLTLGAEVLVDCVEQPQLEERVVLHLHGLPQVNQEQHPEGIDVAGEDSGHLGEVLRRGGGEGRRGGGEEGKGGGEERKRERGE